MALPGDWDAWLARGRAILTARPDLRRNEQASRGLENPRWAWGDLLLEVPEALLDLLADDLGPAVSSIRSHFRSYREVAAKWPPAQRVAASWTAHRELKDCEARFDFLRPGMTMRDAAAMAGKKPLDAKPIGRLTVGARVDAVFDLLRDGLVSKAFERRLRELSEERRVRHTAQRALRERSAQWHEALRALREAQAKKSLDATCLEVILKVRKAAAYLRAVRQAVADPEGVPLVPDHLEAEVFQAFDEVAEAAAALPALRKDDTAIEATARPVRVAGALPAPSGRAV
jgi:hypothetical protein